MVFFQTGDRFSESFAAELMHQMLSAVHYIHSRGVVHRDLKLENFLLESKQGEMEVVYTNLNLKVASNINNNDDSNKRSRTAQIICDLSFVRWQKTTVWLQRKENRYPVLN